MTFKPLLPSHFHKQFKKLTKKDAALGVVKMEKEIGQILKNQYIILRALKVLLAGNNEFENLVYKEIEEALTGNCIG